MYLARELFISLYRVMAPMMTILVSTFISSGGPFVTFVETLFSFIDSTLDLLCCSCCC